jgi:tetratricopeptide (TPR) repeat protein
MLKWQIKRMFNQRAAHPDTPCGRDLLYQKREMNMSKDLLIILKNEVNESGKEKLLPAFMENLDDLIAAYYCAAIHDSLGYEKEAEPYYIKSLQNGIKGKERVGAFLGLGSTYQTIGEYKKAAIILSQGMKEFPEANELKVFHAMTLYNLGSYKEGYRSYKS